MTNAKTTTKLSYRVTHDPEARASYLHLPPNVSGLVEMSKRTLSLGNGVYVDLNAAGDVIGVEWLW